MQCRRIERAAIAASALLASIGTSLTHKSGQRVQPLARLVPPERDRATAVGVDVDVAGAPARFAHFLLVGQSDVDPQFDRTGEIATPQVGLVLGTEPLAEG